MLINKLLNQLLPVMMILNKFFRKLRNLDGKTSERVNEFYVVSFW